MLKSKLSIAFVASCLAISGSAFAAGGQNDELFVDTDADSLVAAYEAVHGLDEYSTQDMTDIREFVGCFVSGLDLPQEVYLQCGMSIVQTATACSEGIANPACLTAIGETVGLCKLPAKNIKDSAMACFKEQQD